jgi:catechol 2,3-dioxygenase-like lactoylglutathione lyase family enzyme
MKDISRRNLVQGGIGTAFLAKANGAAAAMPAFRTPQVNLYSRELPRAAAFYQQFGFKETFRTPATGPIEHIELTLDGFILGIATFEAASKIHKLHPGGEGHWSEIVVRTDDVDGAVKALVERARR